MVTTPEAGARPGRFAGRVVVVTGGGAGVGRQYAEGFAREGAHLVLADIDADAGEAAAEQLRSAGARALAVQMDVADPAAAAEMAERAAHEFGGIDVLVNNAGVHLDDATPPFSSDELPRWRRVLEVNLVGAMNCAAACHEAMRGRGGVILNQSSSAAWRFVDAYDLSKHALNGLTAVLSAKLAPDGIRVVGVAPGLIGTSAALSGLGADRIDAILRSQHVGRLMEMDSLTSVVLFLCSDDAAFIAGTTVVVDAGRRAGAT